MIFWLVPHLPTEFTLHIPMSSVLYQHGPVNDLQRDSAQKEVSTTAEVKTKKISSLTILSSNTFIFFIIVVCGSLHLVCYREPLG